MVDLKTKIIFITYDDNDNEVDRAELTQQTEDEEKATCVIINGGPVIRPKKPR